MKRFGGLSRREYQVACLVARGLSNAQIAERLGIVEVTVTAHIANIFKALGVSRRFYIALYVLKARWLRVEDIEIPVKAKKSEVQQ